MPTIDAEHNASIHASFMAMQMHVEKTESQVIS